MFADDLSISLESNNVRHAGRVLQIAINSVQKWTSLIGFKLSESKSYIIDFTRKHKTTTKPSIQLNNSAIPYKSESKILGVIFDERLRWTNHILETKANCIRNMNILKYLNNRNFGLQQLLGPNWTMVVKYITVHLIH